MSRNKYLVSIGHNGYRAKRTNNLIFANNIKEASLKAVNKFLCPVDSIDYTTDFISIEISPIHNTIK